MKRRACKRLLTAAVLCAALTVPAKAARRSVPVQIDGKPIAVSAYVERGVTYVPLRALLNTMGAWDVWWDEATGRAAAASGDTCLWADPVANTVTIDGKTVRGRVTVENGATYVPLRLVGEALDCQGEWGPYLGGAAVTSPGAAYDAGELYWLSRIICAESGAESMSGQIAVGNVILNRVESSQYPDTVEGVVFDTKYGVQFQPVSNGTIYDRPTDSAVLAAKLCLEGAAPVGDSLYFYAPALSAGGARQAGAGRGKCCRLRPVFLRPGSIAGDVDQRQPTLSADHRLPSVLPVIRDRRVLHIHKNRLP